MNRKTGDSVETISRDDILATLEAEFVAVRETEARAMRVATLEGEAEGYTPGSSAPTEENTSLDVSTHHEL